MRPFVFYLFSFVSLLALSSCKSDNATPIIIPPGAEINFSVENFVYYSDDRYEILARSVGNDNQHLITLLDVTPPQEEKLDPQIKHSLVVPKDTTVTGPVILQVSMDYHNIDFYAITYNEGFAKPGIISTLTYQLLANYPDRSLKTYKEEEISEITSYIEQFASEKMDLFGLSFQMDPILLFNFLRNGLAADTDFLNFLKKFNIHFQLDSNGNIVPNTPQPFGYFNSPPVLDTINSPPTGEPIIGKEDYQLEVSVKAVDPDGDLVFYAWRLNNKLVLKDLQTYVWTPGFSDAGTYKLDLVVSDGGPAVVFSWDLIINNNNRKPTLSVVNGSCATTTPEVTSVTNKAPWVCDFTVTDPDATVSTSSSPEVIYWDLMNTGFSSPPTLIQLDDNGNVLNQVTLNPANSAVSLQTPLFDTQQTAKVRIQWAPDNKDAKDSLSSPRNIDLRVNDGHFGFTFFNSNVKVIDENTNPVLKLFSDGKELHITSSNTTPQEGDSCLPSSDPVNQPYTYEFQVYDPEATNNIQPPDQLSVSKVSYSGQPQSEPNLSSSPISTDLNTGIATFSFDWLPLEGDTNVTYTVNLEDDSGGTTPQNFTLTSINRNQYACFSPSTATPPSDLTINSDEVTSTPATANAEDGDGDTPLIRLENVDLKDIPFLKDCSSNPSKPLVFKQKYYETNLHYDSLSLNSCFDGSAISPYSGVIQFTRPPTYQGTYSNPITIAAGWEFRTASSPYLTFQTVTDITIEPNDLHVLVPVKATNRTVNANQLTVISGFPNLVAQNATALSGDRGVIQISYDDNGDGIPSGVAPNNITIPVGTIFKTKDTLSPSLIPAVQFENRDTITFPAGQASLSNVVVFRKPFTIPANTNFIPTLPLADSSISITNPEVLNSDNNYHIFPYKATGNQPGSDQFTSDLRVYDAQPAPPGTITEMTNPISGVLVTNPSTIVLEGEVQITRNGNTSSLTIAKDFEFKSSDGKIYLANKSIAFPSGSSSVLIPVHRKLVLSPAGNGTRKLIHQMKDYNFRPMADQVPLTTTEVQEGSAILNLLLSVKEQDPADLAKDPDDRFTFSNPQVSSNIQAQGVYELCRTPATSAADIGSCAFPCSSTTGLSFNQSRVCYFRYKPVTADFDNTFLFSTTVSDNGASNGESKTTTLQWTVKATELNDPPQITDASGTPLSAPSLTNPLQNAQRGPDINGDGIGDGYIFVEGATSSFKVYSFDVNKSIDLQTVRFQIVGNCDDADPNNTCENASPAIYDIDKGIWRPVPTGIQIKNIKNTSLNNVNTNTFGAKAEAVIEWTPTDADAKALSSTSGFILRVKVEDSFSAGVPYAQRGFAYTHFLVKVKNVNNPPALATTLTPQTIQADTYFSLNFSIIDKDANAPEGGSFNTQLEACRDALENQAYNTNFDPNPGLPNECHAVAPLWPTEIVDNYDPNYTDNLSVPQCSLNGQLNLDLAVPKISLVGINTSSSQITYNYKIEWCPQKGQLGTHTPTIYVFDNGDVDRAGNVLSHMSTSVALNFKVVAPVFFISPSIDNNGNPVPATLTAVANLPNNPFRFPTIIKNSKGNPVEYSITQAPRPCSDPSGNGVCMGVSGELPGTITWVPSLNDIGSTHRIDIQVRDTVTGETDNAYLLVSVKSPGGAQPPTITSVVPPNNPTLLEAQAQTFTVSATDPNNDALIYTWYVDGEPLSNSSNTFNYIPSLYSGSEDPDGSGPLATGQHKVLVEVSDGNFIASQEWTVNVLNVYVIPFKRFNITESVPFTIKNLSWKTETLIYNPSEKRDQVIFSGHYDRLFPNIGYLTRHFVWLLQIENSNILTSSFANFFDNLPWPAGASTQNINYNINTLGKTEILLTPQGNRNGPFNTSSVSAKAPEDLSTIASVSSCTSSCPPLHYKGHKRYGSLLTAYQKSGNSEYLFYYENGSLYKEVNFTKSSQTPIWNAPAGEVVSAMSILESQNQLYVTTYDPSSEVSKLYIFDTINGTLLVSLTLNDGSTDFLRPSALATNETDQKVYIYLSGVGELAIVNAALGTPGPADISYAFKAEINPSNDAPQSGQKLVYNPNTQILYGISTDSQQVYSVDMSNTSIYTSAAESKVHAIWINPETNFIILVDREKGTVFKGM
ncbi:MAG: hypothetical protein D6797_02440 [Bdellovibrio sp.]|nr:MAG: hypothetical protein D6797_02440 [Bdellovibrio sp.]